MTIQSKMENRTNDSITNSINLNSLNNREHGLPPSSPHKINRYNKMRKYEEQGSKMSIENPS